MADDAEPAAWLGQQLGELKFGCAAEPSAGAATAEHAGAGILHAPAAVPLQPTQTCIQGFAVSPTALLLWECFVKCFVSPQGRRGGIGSLYMQLSADMLKLLADYVRT